MATAPLVIDRHADDPARNTLPVPTTSSGISLRKTWHVCGMCWPKGCVFSPARSVRWCSIRVFTSNPLSFNRNSYDNRDEVTLRIQFCRNEEKSGDAEESTVWLDAGGHVVTECNLRVSDH